MSVSTLQAPSVGRVVVYRLLDEEKAHGGMKHLPNSDAHECPAVIVRVLSDTEVNLRLLTDSGDNPAWRQSVMLGDGVGQWHWPKFVPPRLTTPGDDAQIAAMKTPAGR